MEAITFSTSEGHAELSPERGAVAWCFSPEDVHDSLVVLRNLEGLAGRLACENATDAEIQVVWKLHGRVMDTSTRHNRLP